MLSTVGRFPGQIIAALLLLCPLPALGQQRMLYPHMAHLRSGEARQWTSYPEQAEGDSLTITFTASRNESERTLGLRRIDVKEDWRVVLNDELLGRLFSDENDMDEIFELPPGMLRDGDNQLVIQAGDGRGGSAARSDDILIGTVWLDDRPRDEVFGEAVVRLTARDEQGGPIPCRFTILNDRGSLSAVGATSNDHLAVRSGVVYSSTGTATFGLAGGDYHIYCGRGFEYDLPNTRLRVARGDSKEIDFTLHRVVDTSGLVACDTHVHTLDVSRHGDATLAERMITLAGEGIELACATDHNIFVDYRPHLERMHVQQYLTPIIGSEVTTRYGHFNVFPADPTGPHPDNEAATWDDLFHDIHSVANIPFAILNHPRDVHAGFAPFAPRNMIAAVGRRIDDRRLQVRGVELINSAAMQSDPMVVFHDWLTQVNRGLPLTAVGSSDSHEVSRKIVGQGRSYVFVDDSDPSDIDIDAAVASFLEGRVLVSLGLLTDLTVNGTARSGDMVSTTAEQIQVTVDVHGPDWTTADRVELYANGRLLKSQELSREQGTAAGRKARMEWTVDTPSHDVHLVAVARGPGVRGLYWPVAKPYQPTSLDWQPYVWGSSGIVRMDVDGDGQWTCADQYAAAAVQAADGDFARLMQVLSVHDLPTCIHAADHWVQTGHSLDATDNQALLNAAPDHIRRGFLEYEASYRESIASLNP
jgi:hypothetical protein